MINASLHFLSSNLYFPCIHFQEPGVLIETEEQIFAILGSFLPPLAGTISAYNQL